MGGPVKRSLVLACTLALLAAACAVSAAAAPAARALVSTGDGSWYWRSPQPQGSWLVAASSVGSTVWAVGGGGTILVSHDAGVTWLPQHPGTAVSLQDVTFTDASSGWAVGGDSFSHGADGDLPGHRNVILHTADGGATWRAQPSPGSRPLTAVFFLDALHGWAVGERGTILRTVDGGTSWTRRGLGDALELTSVHFTDARRGWVGGARGRLLRTADGGATWRSAALPRWADYTRLLKPSFVDPQHGYAIFGSPDGWVQSGSGWIVGKTDDGGATWRRALRGDDITAVCAGTGGRVWAVDLTWDNATRFLLSDDGGLTWSSQYVNGILPDDVVPAGGGACAVGSGGAFSSSDGLTWLPRTSWSYQPEDTIAAAGDGSLIGLGQVWDADGGSTLRSLSSADAVSWEPGGKLDLSFATALEAADPKDWLVAGIGNGFSGILQATGDAGRTWRTLLPDRGGTWLDVACPDADHLWTAGIDLFKDKGYLLASTDGGATWSEQAVPRGAIPFAVDFVSAKEGWASFAGQRRSSIAHTLDGGAHWVIQPASTASRTLYNTLEFIDAEHGWATGVDAAGSWFVAATSDGGETWRRTSDAPFSDHSLGGVAFTDSLHGWTWSSTGLADSVWATDDGGATWRAENSGASGGVSCVAAVAGGAAFAASPWQGTLSTADLAGDTAAPFTYDDFDHRYHRRPVSVKLTAADVGGEVAATEYRVDDGGWQPYAAPIQFAAPADHSGDGRHLLRFRSTDTSGNVEADFPLEVPIDTLGPSTAVLRGVRVRRGEQAHVVYRVDDATSRGAYAFLRYERVADGRKYRSVRWFAETNKDQLIGIRCHLLPGRYRMTLEAADLAGNRQVRAGRRLLVVKPARSGPAGAGRTALLVARAGGRRAAHPATGVPRADVARRFDALWSGTRFGRLLQRRLGLRASQLFLRGTLGGAARSYFESSPSRRVPR